MPLRAILPAAAALSVVLAAALAGWTPALGRAQLRWAPVTVGLPLLLAWGAAEVVRQRSRWPTARALATLSIGVSALLVLFPVRIAVFTPADRRDPLTWPEWPLSTSATMLAIAGTLLALSAAAELSWRVTRRRA
jgi:hypothetical protein